MLTTVGAVVGGVILFVIVWSVLSRLNAIRHHRNALKGKYGDEARWASELVEEGDQLFTVALAQLPEMELSEAGIIAESKEEMRELVVERYEEKMPESIPEEFA